MNRWIGTPRRLLFSILAILSVVVVSGLSGCASGPVSPLGRVLQAVGSSTDGLPPEAQRELARFDQVYRRYAATSDNEDKLDYFRFAYKRVRAGYVRPVSDAKMVDAAIDGVTKDKPADRSLNPDALVESALDSMMASLDPHSAYLNAEEFRESHIQTSGEFGGLGIEVTMEDGLVKVVSPIEDTPAYRAGLLSGDLISHVDGKSIKGKSLIEAVRRMRGRIGTQIVLKVHRKGKPIFDLTLTRALIKVRAVRSRLEGDIGYIRVSRFSERVEAGVGNSIQSLRAELGRDPRGYVLDLRGNPGGLLDQSVILADAFLESGEVVSVRGRSSGDVRSFPARGGDLAKGAPMVVLINGGSASASEIVASALQHYRRAVVMGTQSFGKGSVQTIMPLPVEGALRMTTALYYAPSGQTIQARGVDPDIIIEPEKADESQHEADLKGSFAAQNAAKSTRNNKAVPEFACPAVGEKKDRILGCALAYLKAGSEAKFFASYGRREQM